jgi:hypothetical protein
MGSLRKLILEFIAIFVLSWVVEFIYLGVKGVLEGSMVSLLEMSLSFDNAVMNAIVLSAMPPVWRRRFITWGIVFAVFGMRFLFPLLIVSLTAKIGMVETLDLALHKPDVYSGYLKASEEIILSFGGAFLFMVFVNWLFDAAKRVHWILFLEEKASKVARVGEIKLILALSVVLLVGSLKGEESITLSMVFGVLLFEVVNFVKRSIDYFKKDNGVKSGWANFLYLELLDASCSLDGAVSAFAVSTNLIIITIGLSVGAFILRSLTVYFVDTGKVSQLPYIEHGAHWGIGGLGILMILELFIKIPEFVVSLIALFFILSSLYSSFRKLKEDKGESSPIGELSN